MCEQDERVERVRMALAEAGHPEAQVEWDAEHSGVPFDVALRGWALSIAGDDV